VISQLQFENRPSYIEAVAKIEAPEVAQCMVADQHMRENYRAITDNCINSIVEIEVIIFVVFIPFL